jgi:hypothetical protein
MGRNGLDASERMSETCCLKMGGMFSFLPLPFLGEPGSNKCFPLAETERRSAICLFIGRHTGFWRQTGICYNEWDKMCHLITRKREGTQRHDSPLYR